MGRPEDTGRPFGICDTVLDTGAQGGTNGMRDEPRHRPAYGRWVGIGVATGVIAAVALAGLGVWGTATLAARSTDGIATPTVTPTHRAATMPPVGRRGPWLPAARHNRASLDVTGTPRPATAVQHGVTTAETSAATTTATPAHSACAGCTTVFSVALPHNAHLDGVQWRNGDTSAQGWLDYYVADRLVARSGLSEDAPLPGDADHPVAAACVPAARAARCAVSYDTGAHTSAVLLLVAGPTGIHITDRVEGNAAGVALTDLDADGLPDASVLDSTLRPDYGHAPRFWHTYLQRGGKLVSTGCSAPATAPDPRPDRPETGPCLP